MVLKSSDIGNGLFLPTNHRTKQELAYETLREAILTCRLPPGKRLLEAELAEELDMSRSPIREALTRLSQEGLVTGSAYSGLAVAAVGLESLHELYSIWGALEALACREATIRHSDETIQAMSRALEVMKQAMLRQDYSEWRRDNLDFHRLSRQDCAMPYLLRSIEEIASRVVRYQMYDGAMALRVAQSEAEHQSILEAMRVNDTAEVERLVRYHYIQGGRSFSEYLRSLPVDIVLKAQG